MSFDRGSSWTLLVLLGIAAIMAARRLAAWIEPDPDILEDELTDDQSWF